MQGFSLNGFRVLAKFVANTNTAAKWQSYKNTSKRRHKIIAQIGPKYTLTNNKFASILLTHRYHLYCVPESKERNTKLNYLYMHICNSNKY